MTSQLFATYANGVLTPEAPLDLPENMKVGLTVTPLENGNPSEPPAGSAEAWLAYIQHCQASKYQFTRFNRELLYDRG